MVQRTRRFFRHSCTQCQCNIQRSFIVNFRRRSAVRDKSLHLRFVRRSSISSGIMAAIRHGTWWTTSRKEKRRYFQRTAFVITLQISCDQGAFFGLTMTSSRLSLCVTTQWRRRNGAYWSQFVKIVTLYLAGASPFEKSCANSSRWILLLGVWYVVRLRKTGGWKIKRECECLHKERRRRMTFVFILMLFHKSHRFSPKVWRAILPSLLLQVILNALYM